MLVELASYPFSTQNNKMLVECTPSSFSAQNTIDEEGPGGRGEVGQGVGRSQRSVREGASG